MSHNGAVRRASHSHSHAGSAMGDAASVAAEEQQQLGAALVTPLRRFFHLLQQLLDRNAAPPVADSEISGSASPPPNPLAAEYGDILSIMLQAMQPPVAAITQKTISDKRTIEPRQCNWGRGARATRLVHRTRLECCISILTRARV